MIEQIQAFYSARDFKYMMTRNSRLFIAVIIVLFFARAEAKDDFTPWDYVTHEKKLDFPAGKEMSLPASLLKAGVVFFNKFVSPVDGDRCFMYPTCAAYSREALEKHGFFVGILMTADRLIHEENEKGRAPIIKVGDRLRYLDPLTNNNFWWRQEKNGAVLR